MPTNAPALALDSSVAKPSIDSPIKPPIPRSTLLALIGGLLLLTLMILPFVLPPPNSNGLAAVDSADYAFGP